VLAYILLGSNIDAEKNLARAADLLAGHVDIVSVSPVFKSRPVGNPDQPCYLNAIVAIDTTLSPGRLRATVLRPVEASLGRVRSGDKYGPRTIDLDLVFYGEGVTVCGGRHLPDPDLLKHAHIAVPLASLAPDMVHPETGETMRAIAARLSNDAIQQREDVIISRTYQHTEGE
jgi:2-amino-4-hydroxy-6-hydroxymethyldihydropteridine diphosphokinase